MPDQRSLTNKIDFKTDEAINQLEAVRESLQEITEETYEAEYEISKYGSEAAAAAGAAASGFKGAADEVQSFGSAVARSAGKSLKEYNSLPKAIKAGVGGGLDYIQNKTNQFVKKTITGAGNITKAFLHPVQTIKGKLVDALEEAGTQTKDTGQKARDSQDDFEKMGDAGEDAGKSIKDAISGAAAKLVALKAGFEIVKKGFEIIKNLGTELINVGKETQTVNAQFSAVFSGQEIGAWVDNFSGAVNRSRTEIKSFLVSNKTLYQGLGITGEAADQLSKITTSLAYDIGAALKLDDAEALSAVQDYISGNAAALSQYGVQIDDAVIKQSALDMGFGSNIDSLNEAQMAQVRMNALLENSTSIQRQAAEGQTGYANNIKSLKAVMMDFGEKADEKFSPIFDKLTGSILKSWPKIEPALLKFIGYLGDKGIGAALPELVNLAATALPPFIEMLMQAADAAQPIGTALLSLATTALPPLVTALAPVVGIIGELAGTVLPPLGGIIAKISETIIPPFVQILGTLNKTVITPLMPVISQIADAVLPALAAGMQALSPLLEAVSPILTGIGTVLGDIVGFLAKVVEYAAGGIGTVIEKVAGFFNGGGSAGTSIPHNARGTDNFKGGLTYINEQGGEIAVLPSGSKVIPADKSEKIAEGVGGEYITVPVTIELNINVNGQADEKLIEEIKNISQSIAEKVSKAVYEKMEARRIERQAIQEGLT
ncbi:MAG: hypothetical protein K2O16_03050 [Lachnospiraceae bacterium]|nr:hypothetical protein [Lachnospiraceae bacterium]